MNQTKQSVPNETPGRNAPCPCGSGEKFKKCCMPLDEAQKKPQTGEDAVIVCLPTRGSVSHETLLSLEQNMGGVKHGIMRIARKPVAEARNILAAHVLKNRDSLFPFKPRETFILWVDDDAWLPPGLVPTMLEAMNDPQLERVDALFAWFCTRTPFAKPVAYRRLDDPESFPKIGVDCKHGDVVPIEAAGFHTVMMRLRLLERIGPDPFTPNPAYQEGEDWAFCRHAKEIGALMAVGTSLPSVHVDPRDGTAYMVGMPAGMMDGNSMRGDARSSKRRGNAEHERNASVWFGRSRSGISESRGRNKTYARSRDGAASYGWRGAGVNGKVI